jgi:hypothetical protein
MKHENIFNIITAIRFIWGAVDFNDKVRKILDGGNLTLKLWTWNH